MVFVYIKIYYAAHERARRVINKPGLAKRISRRVTGKSNIGSAAQAANTAASVAAANKKGKHLRWHYYIFFHLYLFNFMYHLRVILE